MYVVLFSFWIIINGRRIIITFKTNWYHSFYIFLSTVSYCSVLSHSKLLWINKYCSKSRLKLCLFFIIDLWKTLNLWNVFFPGNKIKKIFLVWKFFLPCFFSSASMHDLVMFIDNWKYSPFYNVQLFLECWR